MEPDTPAGVEMPETLGHFLRMAIVLVKHRVSSKSKLLLHLLKTTRVKAIKKALSDAVVFVPSLDACLSRDDVAGSYISPRPLRHYEFSCSNTPASSNFLIIRRRRKRRRVAQAPPTRRYMTESEASPLVRINDSPSSVCHVVDMEAERFIEMFYRELRLQKLMAAPEAPDPYASTIQCVDHMTHF